MPMGRYGARGSVEQGARWRRRLDAATKPYRPRLFLVYPLRLDVAPPAEGYELVEADGESLALLRRRYPKQYTAFKYEAMRARLGTSAPTCWLIYNTAGTPVGFCHVAHESLLDENKNYRVVLGEGECHLIDDRVFRQHRGRGAHRYSIARRLEMLRDRGFHRVQIFVARTNHASRRAYAPFLRPLEAVLVYLPRAHRTLRVPVRRREKAVAGAR